MIYDISKCIFQGMEVYEGDPEVRIKEVFTVAKDGFSLREIRMNTHTGTHLDAPSHLAENGDTVDELDLDLFFGHVLVVETYGDEVPPGTQRLLGKSGYLTLQRARELTDLGVRVIGTTHDSIEEDFPYAVHETLLRNGTIILENLVLEGIKPGNYTLVAFPLKISGADGSPVRVVLLDDICGSL